MVKRESAKQSAVNRRTTLNDIAKAAGVSMMTVSRALNNEDRISEETRKKVINEANRLGYRPNYSARALRSGESRMIGIMSPDLQLASHVEMVQGATDVAAQEGYGVFLQVDVQNQQPSPSFDSDGDLVIGKVSRAMVQEHAFDPIRTVGLMGGTNEIDSCNTDLAEATLVAFRHLLKVGYRRIGLIQHPDNTPQYGRTQALNDARLANDPQLVQYAENDEESVRRSLHTLMALPERPDAIAVVHVAGTPFVIRELQRHRFTIGRDIGFVGTEVSRNSWGDLVTPRMTAIVLPSYQRGAAGARQLIARLQGDDSPPTRFEFPSTLVVRDSTPGQWSPGNQT